MMSRQGNEPEYEEFLSFASEAGAQSLREAPSIDSHVRYLASFLASDEEARHLDAVTNQPEARKQLIRVQKVLSSLKARPLKEAVLAAHQDSYEGSVAKSWLQIIEEITGVMVELDEKKPALKEIPARPAWVVAMRTIFQAARAPRQILMATHRGEGDLEPTIEADFDLRAGGTVRVTAAPAVAAAWEGREIEVRVRGQVPVVIGSGAMKDGRVDIQVPESTTFGGELDASMLWAGPPEDPSEDLTVSLMEREEDRFEGPRQASRLTIAEGVLRGTLAVPRPLRTAFAGKRLELFLEIAPKHSQKLVDLELEADREEYAFEVEMPNAPKLNGRVGGRLKYRIHST